MLPLESKILLVEDFESLMAVQTNILRSLQSLTSRPIDRPLLYACEHYFFFILMLVAYNKEYIKTPPLKFH